MSAKEESIRVYNMFLSFPKVKGDSTEKTALFKEINDLIEKSKETLPKEVTIRKKKNQVILDSDDFMVSLDFGKVVTTRFVINKPSQNLETVNKLSNTVISFLNAVLKDKANGSHALILEVIYPKQAINLSSKIVGTAQLAKANEIAKETLTPIAIAFEYKKNNVRYLLSSYYSENTDTQISVTAQKTFEEALPFDILRQEYENLNYSLQLIVKLSEGSFS